MTAWFAISRCTPCAPGELITSMANSVREILGEPSIVAQLDDTQQMMLLLADAKDFGILLRQTGQRLGPGRAREQYSGVATTSMGPARGLAITRPL
jgi:hypothetical protein